MLKNVGAGSKMTNQKKAKDEVRSAEHRLCVLGFTKMRCLVKLRQIDEEITSVERRKDWWQLVLNNNEPHVEEEVEEQEQVEEEGVKEEEAMEEEEVEDVEEQEVEEVEGREEDDEEAMTPDVFDAAASETEDEAWLDIRAKWRIMHPDEPEPERSVFQDVEEPEQAEEEEEERAEEEGGENEPDQGEDQAEEKIVIYALQWCRQGGDDRGIPKEYTPCKFFFKAGFGCRKGEECEFSHHADLFGQEPFSTVLKSLRWERKETSATGSKTRQEEAPRRRSPRQRHREEAPLKKVRRPARGSSSHAEDAPRRPSHVKEEEDDEEDAPMPKRGTKAFKKQAKSPLVKRSRR